jgi:hypothetical protein
VLWNRNGLLRFLFWFLLWKVLVPVLVPVPVPVPNPDLAQFFNNEIVRFLRPEAALFSRKLAFNF